jgi:uncharacterized protein YxjI
MISGSRTREVKTSSKWTARRFASAKRWSLKTAKGRKLAQIKERILAIKDTMVIEDASGRDIATVKKALIAPLRDKWNVNVKGGDDLVVQGNILDLEYDIRQGRRKVAEVSKKWFTLTDTYGVEIADGQNEILILAVAIAVDMMAHDEA